MSQQDQSEPPPAYEKVASTAGPASAAVGPSAGGSTSSPASSSAAANAGQSTGGAGTSNTNQSAAVNEQGQRNPRRHNSYEEEVDIEDETRPLPPGWVPQYSDQHDRKCGCGCGCGNRPSDERQPNSMEVALRILGLMRALWDALGFFFVDTLDPNGPRSIWTHPLDDPEWKKKVPNGMDPIAYVHKLWQEVVSRLPPLSVVFLY